MDDSRGTAGAGVLGGAVSLDTEDWLNGAIERFSYAMIGSGSSLTERLIFLREAGRPREPG